MGVQIDTVASPVVMVYRTHGEAFVFGNDDESIVMSFSDLTSWLLHCVDRCLRFSIKEISRPALQAQVVRAAVYDVYEAEARVMNAAFDCLRL